LEQTSDAGNVLSTTTSPVSASHTEEMPSRVEQDLRQAINNALNQGCDYSEIYAIANEGMTGASILFSSHDLTAASEQ
jgi:hypothetical protein